MNGRIEGVEAQRAYILAGHARFTIVGTDRRYTYEVKRGKRRDSPWFVRVLIGPENTADYQYAGLISASSGKDFYPNRRPNDLSADTPSVVAFAWVWDRLRRDVPIAPAVMYHEGRCGRCGRVLTTPESVTRGVGPECAGKAA